MRFVRRVLTILMVLCLTLSTASAEVTFLPQFASWTLENYPLTLSLTADLTTRMPFDDNRLAQLSALLSHVSLRLDWQQLQDETWSRATVMVDNEDAMTIARRDKADTTLMQLSSMPHSTYAVPAGAADPLGMLLGDEASPMDFEGLLDGTEWSWLTEGEALFVKLYTLLSTYMTEKDVKKSIESMGTARLQQTFTIPEENAGELSALLSNSLEEGKVKGLLTSLMFSGKQTIILLKSETGALLRATYEGKCGTDEEHLRKVTLTWSMRRDNDNTRDTISLKSPAVKGTDSDTVTVKRVATDKNGEAKLSIDLTYETVADKLKTKLTGEVDLERATTEEGDDLAGEVTLKLTRPDDTTARLVLTPELHFPLSDTPSVNGTVQVEEVENKIVTTAVTLHGSLSVGKYFDWELRDETVAVDTLTAEAAEALRQEIADSATKALIVPMVLLPREDTLYLSADLPEETWQAIVEAAQNAHE